MTDDIFNKKVSKKPFALVEFTADWSGSGYIMDKILGKLNEEFGKNVAFYQIDFEIHTKTSKHYNIDKVPTILLFRNGELIDRISGIISEAELVSRIHEIMPVSFNQKEE